MGKNVIDKLKSYPFINKIIEKKVLIAAFFLGIILIGVITINTMLLLAPLFKSIFVAVMVVILFYQLKNSPMWVHAGILIVLILVGIYYTKALFMLLNCAIYVATLIAFYMLKKEGI